MSGERRLSSLPKAAPPRPGGPRLDGEVPLLGVLRRPGAHRLLGEPRQPGVPASTGTERTRSWSQPAPKCKPQRAERVVIESPLSPFDGAILDGYSAKASRSGTNIR